MKLTWPIVQIAGQILVALAVGAAGASAHDPETPNASQVSPPFRPEQLDQMLAPIALYPDPLLAEILMAATYPLEVVEANRWIQDSTHAKLDAGRLAAVLEQEPWDPSVKSLVPFRQILKMMDDQLEWTERLGEAFLADQAGVMDSIQRLREQARLAGNLRSTAEQTVSVEGVGKPIMIEPSHSESISVPDYNPSLAYGPWPNSEYPPLVFPGYLGGDGIAFVIVALRHWQHWDWVHHRIEIDPNRFAALNRDRQPIGGVVWEHDPFHRQGVGYRLPAVQSHFGGRDEAAPVRVLRGYSNIGTTQVRPDLRPIGRTETPRPALIAPRPPTFGTLNRGADTRILRQYPTGRLVPAGRAAAQVGGIRMSPYGQPR